jgi:hypothetical protein
VDDAVGVDDQECIRRAFEDAAVELDFPPRFFAHFQLLFLCDGLRPLVRKLTRLLLALAQQVLGVKIALQG